jgi:hypothetical protein
MRPGGFAQRIFLDRRAALVNIADTPPLPLAADPPDEQDSSREPRPPAPPPHPVSEPLPTDAGTGLPSVDGDEPDRVVTAPHRAASAELQRLAREGEARRVAAEAEAEAGARTDAIRQRREVRRLGASNLLNALADSPRNSSFSLFRWTLAATVASAVLWGAGELFGGRTLANGGLIGVLVIPFLYFGGRRIAGILALRRERAWLHDLPFPVRGYFALLSSTPEEERTATVAFRLMDEGPDEDVIRGLAGRSGGAVSVSRARGGWKIESGVIWSPAGDDSPPTHGPLLAWMRAVITETLLPLHAEHRITGVRFRG